MHYDRSFHITKLTLVLIAALLNCTSFLKASNPETDSLLKALDTAGTNHVKTKLHRKIAWNLQYENTDKAAEHALKALDFATNEEDLYYAYSYCGIIYWRKGDYTKALGYYKNGVEMAERLGAADNQDGEKKLSSIYNKIGILYDELGMFDKSLDYYFKSLTLREKYGASRATIASSYGNIGIVYHRQDDFNNAMKYYRKSINIAREMVRSGDEKEVLYGKKRLAGNLNNLGMAYSDLKKYDKALDAYKESLRYKKEAGNQFELNSAYSNIGHVLFDQKRVLEAREFYKKALEVARKSQDYSGIASSTKSLGKIDLYEEKYESAEEKFLMAYRLSDSLEIIHEKKYVCEFLGLLYDKMGHYDKALKYTREFYVLKDSLLSASKSREIGRLEAQHDMENQLISQKAEVEKQRLQSYGLAGGIGFFILLSLVAIRAYFTKRKDNKKIALQKALVEEKNTEITASISYAQRIQKALLKRGGIKSAETLKHFILFKPKDIVSGDFFWALEKERSELEITSPSTRETQPGKPTRYLYIAAADCTGHGVPGAFLTMLGSSFLNEINSHEELLTPADILNQLRERIVNELSQTGEADATKDGMDIALVRLELSPSGDSERPEGCTLQYAGANNPLWIIRANAGMSPGNLPKEEVLTDQLHEVKADKQPIGYADHSQPFTNHTIKLHPGDRFYLFSDGFPDQFGGPKGKKFKYKPFKRLLLSIQNKSMDEQKQHIHTVFEQWKGDLEQVDDVCVIGVQI